MTQLAFGKQDTNCVKNHRPQEPSGFSGSPDQGGEQNYVEFVVDFFA